MPNFIDRLAATETLPTWLPWLMGPGFLVLVSLSFAFAVWLTGRDFRRDRDNATRIFDVNGKTTMDRWDIAPSTAVIAAWFEIEGNVKWPAIWVNVVSEGAYSVPLREADRNGVGARIAGTISGPRHEYRWRALTVLLRGQVDVYTATVRDRPEDPDGAQALAHELGCHLWPHLMGRGWNAEAGEHDGHPDKEAAEVAAKLSKALNKEG